MAVKRDRFHKKAASHYRRLSKEKVPLVTSNYVLAETYTRIRYDDGHSKAIQFNSLIQEAIRAGRVHVEWVTPAVHKQAWAIFEKHSDQDFSFVDCTSFAIAARSRIKEVFGFDEHFNVMGLALRP